MTFKFAAVWLPVSIVVPFAVALGLNSRYLLGVGRDADAVLRPVRRPVRRRRADLEPDARLRRAGSTRASGSSAGRTRRTGCTTTTWIYPGFAIIGIWGIGAGIIINLAGLRGIPTELYEAARIDGAGAWKQLRHVTIPMMSPVLFYSLILGIVEVLQYFLVPLVLKNGTGEPGGSTMFYNLNIFRTFFTFQEHVVRGDDGLAPVRDRPRDHARPVPALAAVRVLRGRAMTAASAQLGGATAADGQVARPRS